MNSISGLPAHPLLVHLPVVAIPLAAVGVVLMVIRTSWWERYRWVTLALALLGAVGAILAAGSGEDLEEAVEATASRSLISEHAEAGEAARLAAVVFFLIVLAAVVVVPRVLRRYRTAAAGSTTTPAGPRWVRVVTVVALLVGAAVANWTIIDAGHSGATSVWGDVRVEGGDEDDDDDDEGYDEGEEEDDDD